MSFFGNFFKFILDAQLLAHNKLLPQPNGPKLIASQSKFKPPKRATNKARFSFDVN